MGSAPGLSVKGIAEDVRLDHVHVGIHMALESEEAYDHLMETIQARKAVKPKGP